MRKKKVVAFGASSSKKSINKQLAAYAANQVAHAEVDFLDLNDFEMPIYSIDKENEKGIHELAYKFKEHIKNADGIVISFTEHNGSYSAAFKNIFDWMSRIKEDTWMSKPMFLLATSPGPRGGKTVLETAVGKFKLMNPNTIVSFSLPLFNQNFSEEEGIIDPNLKMEFDKKLEEFSEAL